MRHDGPRRYYDGGLALLWEPAVYENHIPSGTGWLQKETDALANNLFSHRSSIQASEGV